MIWQVDSLVRGLRFNEDGPLVKLLEKFKPLLEDFLASRKQKPFVSRKHNQRRMVGEAKDLVERRAVLGLSYDPEVKLASKLYTLKKVDPGYYQVVLAERPTKYVAEIEAYSSPVPGVGSFWVPTGFYGELKKGIPPEIRDELLEIQFTSAEAAYTTIMRNVVPEPKPFVSPKFHQRRMVGENLTEATRGPELGEIAFARASLGEIIVTRDRTYRYPAKELYELHRRSQAKNDKMSPWLSSDDIEKAKGRIKNSGWEGIGVAEIEVYTDGYMAFDSLDAYVDVAMKMGYTGDIKVQFRFAKIPSEQGLLKQWAVDMTSSKFRKKHVSPKHNQRRMVGETAGKVEDPISPGIELRD